MPKVPKITILQYLCNISRKTRMKSIFWQQINIKDFFRLIQYNSCLPKYGQITQNSKFIISLQYLKKEMSNEVDILHAVKHQVGVIKHSQSTGNNKFAIYLEYPKNEVRDGIHFLHADKHKSLILF